MKLEEIDNIIDNIIDISPLEKAKLKVEYERLRIEGLKMWGTALSIIIPLLVVTITIIYGVWSENERARTNFEIKAVEIIMNALSPQAARNKTIVLSELFPERLPKNFKEKMLSMYPESSREDSP